MARRNRGTPNEEMTQVMEEADIRQTVIDDTDDLFGYAAFGELEVILRKKDGWINVTQLCRQCGKYFKNWLANKASKKMVAKFENILGYPSMDLVRKGELVTRGTYGHALVVSAVAWWISPSFGARMCEWIEEWKLIDSNMLRYMNTLGTIEPESADQLEQSIRDQLAAELGGDTEVECESGWIDLLTETHLIEVKKAKLWKHAVGQLIMYGLDYPNHQLTMHLFSADRCDRELIKEKCSTYHINVVFH